jgi:hypothetical protein
MRVDLLKEEEIQQQQQKIFCKCKAFFLNLSTYEKHFFSKHKLPLSTSIQTQHNIKMRGTKKNWENFPREENK